MNIWYIMIIILDLLKSYFNPFLDNNNKLICINSFLIQIGTKILLLNDKFNNFL